MLKRTERISLRISSVLSKVEPEPHLHTGCGSDQEIPAPAPQHCPWRQLCHIYSPSFVCKVHTHMLATEPAWPHSSIQLFKSTRRIRQHCIVRKNKTFPIMSRVNWRTSYITRQMANKLCHASNGEQAMSRVKWWTSCACVKWWTSCVCVKWWTSCVCVKWWTSCVCVKWWTSCVCVKWCTSCVTRQIVNKLCLRQMVYKLCHASNG